jgi:hypothetical protein
MAGRRDFKLLGVAIHNFEMEKRLTLPGSSHSVGAG